MAQASRCSMGLGLLGHWANEDCETRGVIGYSFVIGERDGEYRFASYGKCHPSWCVSTFTVQATPDGFEGQNNYGFKKEDIKGVLEADSLTVKIDKIFTDDSGRADQHEKENFKRVNGSLRDMEAYLTKTFYTPHGDPGINKMIADLRLCKCEEDVHLYYAKEIENLKDRINHNNHRINHLEKTKAETGSNMTPVFVATKKKHGFLAAATVTFDSVEFDPSGVLDKDKGEFVASKQGLYVFFFYCAVRAKDNKPAINVRVNGGVTNNFHDHHNNHHSFTQLWSDNLKKGDKLSLQNYTANTLYTDGNDHLNFMGFLIA